jgi:hypothetical protein
VAERSGLFKHPRPFAGVAHVQTPPQSAWASQRLHRSQAMPKIVGGEPLTSVAMTALLATKRGLNGRLLAHFMLLIGMYCIYFAKAFHTHSTRTVLRCASPQLPHG